MGTAGEMEPVAGGQGTGLDPDQGPNASTFLLCPYTLLPSCACCCTCCSCRPRTQAFGLAPLFVWFELLFLLGYRPALKKDLAERVKLRVAEMNAAAVKKVK